MCQTLGFWHFSGKIIAHGRLIISHKIRDFGFLHCIICQIWFLLKLQKFSCIKKRQVTVVYKYLHQNVYPVKQTATVFFRPDWFQWWWRIGSWDQPQNWVPDEEFPAQSRNVSQIARGSRRESEGGAFSLRAKSPPAGARKWRFPVHEVLEVLRLWQQQAPLQIVWDRHLLAVLITYYSFRLQVLFCL